MKTQNTWSTANVPFSHSESQVSFESFSLFTRQSCFSIDIFAPFAVQYARIKGDNILHYNKRRVILVFQLQACLPERMCSVIPQSAARLSVPAFLEPDSICPIYDPMFFLALFSICEMIPWSMRASRSVIAILAMRRFRSVMIPSSSSLMPFGA